MENYIDLDDSQAVWYSKDSLVLRKEMGYTSMEENETLVDPMKEPEKPYILTPKMFKRARIKCPTPEKKHNNLIQLQPPGPSQLLHENTVENATPQPRKVKFRGLPVNNNIRSPFLLNTPPLAFAVRTVRAAIASVPPPSPRPDYREMFFLPPPPQPSSLPRPHPVQNNLVPPRNAHPLPPSTVITPVSFSPFNVGIFQSMILRLPSGANIGIEDLVRGRLIGVIFAADFCPASQNFFQKLQIFYENIRSLGKNFEVIWVPGGFDENGQSRMQQTARWPHLEPTDIRVAHFLQYFNIQKIPSFHLCTPQGEILSSTGYEEIFFSNDPPIKVWRGWKRRYSHRLLII
ncbi:unnamed protein product [Bursaphelenchus xylophilus]|uniref:protein-disulfide reductase n=1 Tax=Bursaphelenchus xylophilus TaxID=6326 RepID=A0A1I7S044_BURXY|nr:unnamed protein product [Bursaphelenchus xylophilus]CAG9109028.1 unnamed protein product [Bursaphelenchus xylophilus]